MGKQSALNCVTPKTVPTAERSLCSWAPASITGSPGPTRRGLLRVQAGRQAGRRIPVTNLGAGVSRFIGAVVHGGDYRTSATERTDRQ